MREDQFENLIHESARLRGLGKFQEAISLVKSKLSELENDFYLNAYKEIFSAYVELGDRSKASEYAQKLYLIEPEMPSIQSYLKKE